MVLAFASGIPLQGSFELGNEHYKWYRYQRGQNESCTGCYGTRPKTEENKAAEADSNEAPLSGQSKLHNQVKATDKK